MEGRLYNESMTGVTAKSKGKSTEKDEKELARLQNKDLWLQISRAKLMMDLIFVCEYRSAKRAWQEYNEGHNRLRAVPDQTREGHRQSLHRSLIGYSQVRRHQKGGNSGRKLIYGQQHSESVQRTQDFSSQGGVVGIDNVYLVT